MIKIKKLLALNGDCLTPRIIHNIATSSTQLVFLIVPSGWVGTIYRMQNHSQIFKRF